MIILYTEKEFNSASNCFQKFPLQCKNCQNTFYKERHIINSTLNGNKSTLEFCSRNCASIFKNQKPLVSCKQCGKEFRKQLKEIKKCKNNFCSHSCSSIYNNKYKNYGYRRSKIELFLEEMLKLAYTNMVIDFNNREKIGLELDIYIPSMLLAFEINGPTHYKPIYGLDRFLSIQKKDNKKRQLCLQQNIELITIDISNMTYFKKSKAESYLKLITNIIDYNLKLT